MLRAAAALATVVAVVAGGAVLGACTSPRNALGTTANQCYQALPVAADAVHERGSLQGVMIIDARKLSPTSRLRSVLAVQANSPVRTVCAFSYRGVYRTDQVERPLGRGPAGSTGTYAVVMVSSPQNQLLATFVLDHQPLRFRHEL